MFNTIRSKFIFIAVAIIIAGVTISNILIIRQLRENFQNQTELMLETTLDVMHNGLYNEMMTGKKKNIQLVVDNLAKNDRIDHIRIINKKGIIKYASRKSEINKLAKDFLLGNRNIPDINTRTITPTPDDERYSATEPIFNETKCLPCHKGVNIIAYLDVETNLQGSNEKFYSGALSFIIISGIVVILLAFSLYLLFDRLINKPLLKFIGALNNVKEGDLKVQLPANHKNEFGILHANFNNMVRKLKSSKEKIEELHTEQLQRTDRLVTLGELTAEMAHEINNHSAIIMARADYLQLESNRNQDLGKYEEDLSAILHQTDVVSKITGNILKHSKNQPKLKQKLNLAEIVDECLYILKPVIIKHKVDIKKTYKTTNAIITGDQLDIEQVIMNLVNNAIDSIESGGLINIGLDQNSEGKIILSLTDNGSGIEDSVIDQIFLPFFTTKEPGKGTGLGLYIIKNICDKHSAKISCKSKTGIGTTFTIEFEKVYK
ncbi:MAG: HAMP domain-containing sensor histidine kinase [Ignavibacteriaceae bacterium]